MDRIYQKRGNEILPLDIPAEIISVNSEKFKATNTKGALEELESKFSDMYATEGIRQMIFAQEGVKAYDWPWVEERKAFIRLLDAEPMDSNIVGDLDPSLVTLGANHNTFTIQESGFYFVKVRGAELFGPTGAPEIIWCNIRTAVGELELTSTTSGKNANAAWFNTSVIFYFEAGTELYFELLYPLHVENTLPEVITSTTQSIIFQFMKMPSVNKLEKNRYSGGEWGHWDCPNASILKRSDSAWPGMSFIDFPSLSDVVYRGNENPKTFKLTEHGVEFLEDGQYYIRLEVYYGLPYSSTGANQIPTSALISINPKDTEFVPNYLAYDMDDIRTLGQTSPKFCLKPSTTLNITKGDLAIGVIDDDPSLAINIESVSWHICKIQEPAALSIPDSTDYYFDPATGGHRGLIPDIPAAQVMFPGQALRMDMSMMPKVEELEIHAIGPDQGSATGSIHYKSGYSLGAEHGIRRNVYEQAFVRNPNDQGDKCDYKLLATVENNKQIQAFYTNLIDGSEGLHWYDLTSGEELTAKQIMRAAVGYAARVVGTLPNVTIDKCVIGALVTFSGFQQFLPQIGTWEVCYQILLRQNGMIASSNLSVTIYPGGTLISFGTQGDHITVGWARRIY